jgi:hypothetical protein
MILEADSLQILSVSVSALVSHIWFYVQNNKIHSAFYTAVAIFLTAMTLVANHNNFICILSCKYYLPSQFHNKFQKL